MRVLFYEAESELWKSSISTWLLAGGSRPKRNALRYLYTGSNYRPEIQIRHLPNCGAVLRIYYCILYWLNKWIRKIIKLSKFEHIKPRKQSDFRRWMVRLVSGWFCRVSHVTVELIGTRPWLYTSVYKIF